MICGRVKTNQTEEIYNPIQIYASNEAFLRIVLTMRKVMNSLNRVEKEIFITTASQKGESNFTYKKDMMVNLIKVKKEKTNHKIEIFGNKFQ